MNKLFKVASRIILKLEEEGYEGYFVGGSVRDFLLNRPINDVDITTDALPDDIERIFDKTIDVGKEHGTIVVLIDQDPFEVTTYRVEGDYSNYRRPDQVFFTNKLSDDLSRRDFTINAMAMSKDMKVFDPFDGQVDLKNRVIRTVGKAEARFGEDALRMLRAVRFMSQLDFQLSEDVISSIEENGKLLQHIASERSFVELDKLYRGKNPQVAKSVIDKTNLLHYLPFYSHVSHENFLSSKVSNLADELILQIYLKSDLHDYLHELKPSNKLKAYINNSLSLIETLDTDIDSRIIAYRFERTVLEGVTEINRTNQILTQSSSHTLSDALDKKESLIIKDRSELAINGKDLMDALGIAGGPWLKEALNLIEIAVLTEEVNNNKTDIINWVKKHANDQNGTISFT